MISYLIASLLGTTYAQDFSTCATQGPGQTEKLISPKIQKEYSGLSLLQGSDPRLTLAVSMYHFYQVADVSYPDVYQCQEGVTTSQLAEDPIDVANGETCRICHTFAVDYTKCNFPTEDTETDDGKPVTLLSGSLFLNATVDVDWIGGTVTRVIERPMGWIVQLARQLEVDTSITVEEPRFCIPNDPIYGDALCNTVDTKATCVDGKCACSVCHDGNSAFTGDACTDDRCPPQYTCAQSPYNPYSLEITDSSEHKIPQEILDMLPKTAAQDNLSDNLNLVANFNPASPTPSSYSTNGQGVSLSQSWSLSVTDEAQNTGETCEFKVQLVDKVPPTVTCPDPLVTNERYTYDQLRAMGRAEDTPFGSTGDYGIVDILVTCDGAFVDTDALPEALYTCLYIGRDYNGNTDSCTFTYTYDKTAPTFAPCEDVKATTGCAAPVDGNLYAVPYVDPTFEDSLSGLDGQTYSHNKPTVNTMAIGDSDTITYEYSDNAGNQATCEIDRSLTDDCDPTITCADQEYSVAGSSAVWSTLDTIEPATAADNSGSVSITYSFQDGSYQSWETLQSYVLSHTYGTPYEVTARATDGSGLTKECTLEVTVKDPTPPALLCQSDEVALNLNTLTSIEAQITDGLADAACTDNGNSCSVIKYALETDDLAEQQNGYALEYASAAESLDTSRGPGTYYLFSYVHDGDNNWARCKTTIKVEDTFDPYLDCTVPTQAICVDDNGAYWYDPEYDADDNFGFSVIIRLDGVVTDFPQTFTAGNSNSDHAIEIVVTDVYQRQTSCGFQVTFKDCSSPIVSCENKIG